MMTRGHTEIFVWVIIEILTRVNKGFTAVSGKNMGITSSTKGVKPTTAPIDINESIQHELDSLNVILKVIGNSSGSGSVADLTGISIQDCVEQIKGQDLNSVACSEFIQILSNCESLTSMHVKNLLETAKKKYKQYPNSKTPCFGEK